MRIVKKSCLEMLSVLATLKRENTVYSFKYNLLKLHSLYLRLTLIGQSPKFSRLVCSECDVDSNNGTVRITLENGWSLVVYNDKVIDATTGWTKLNGMIIGMNVDSAIDRLSTYDKYEYARCVQCRMGIGAKGEWPQERIVQKGRIISYHSECGRPE